MKIRSAFAIRLFTLAWLAGAQFFASHAAGPNLIVNGGFENGFTGWNGTWGYYDSPNTVSGARVGVLTDISSSSVGQTMYQNVPTTPGWTYEIKFALRLPEFSPGSTIPVVGESRGGSTTISLLINDVSLASIPVVNRNTWNFYTYAITAVTSSTRINFYNPSIQAWPFIDEVTMAVVPEPQTAILLVLGASGLLLRCRRPHRAAAR